MSPSEINALHILHVFGGIGLVGSVFYACAAPLETRKRLLAWSGAISVIVLLTGARLWGGLYHFSTGVRVADGGENLGGPGFTGWWVIVKIVCWAGISALAGIAYRRREKAGVWIATALALAAVALTMAYTRPF